MLNSLYIKNFRNLQKLKIKSLERVNLITGKNNTGKSSILEALALYFNEGSTKILREQLYNRGEFDNDNKDDIEENIKSLSSIFFNRKISFDVNDSIVIGEVENALLGDTISSTNSLTLQLVKYLNGTQYRKRVITENDEIDDYEIGLNISFNDFSYIRRLDNIFSYLKSSKQPFQFISTKSVEKGINSQLWDNITLTDKEEYVINALKIIEPEVVRLAFIEGYRSKRIPVIKLRNEKQVLPLKSMGDGINRILTIILALVNAEGGMLLIDEFENGLHHTVQEQLWKMIFLLAEDLDIQVFATTHSEDCIRGFENVLNDYNIETGGKLIRLDRKNGQIRQVEFDKEELKVATDFGIEIR